MLSFQAGKVTENYDSWALLTKDKFILDIIHDGLKIDFFEEPCPFQTYSPHFTTLESRAIELEIQTLLQKQVISECQREPGDFVSPIFTREKKDGSLRVILNLKNLNNSVYYNHFKLESLDNVLNIIQTGVWMASVDLKDAFYTIPVHASHQKYLKFSWKDKLYKFQAMPNGYAEAMRVFTKILKPPFSYLRQRGFSSVVFVDDTYLQGSSFEECLQNVHETVAILQKLGFTIHAKKSVLTPTQCIEFLGFIIDSRSMTVTLSGEKRDKIMHKIRDFRVRNTKTIRDLASIIGSLISTFPAVPLGPLHYRNLERFKIQQLKLARGNFQAVLVTLPLAAMEKIFWWESNLISSFRNIKTPPVDCTITTDASHKGWGATDGHTPTGGRWGLSEKTHINVLELKAAFFAIKAYCSSKVFKHIRIRSDNCTAIAYINHMGGIKALECDTLAKELWEFCNSRNIWLSAAYIPGKINTVADKLSREFNDQTEWMLQPSIFQNVVEKMQFYPDVDLFASRLNHQVDKYVSWTPDPDSMAVDAFSVSWSNINFYAYPPFSIVGAAISKIVQDRATGIMIIPYWTSQYWYPTMQSLLVKDPIILPQIKTLITLPFNPEARHPLIPKTKLLAVLLSGDALLTTTFQQRLAKSSWNHGGKILKKNTTQYLDGGRVTAPNEMKMPFALL